MTETFWKRPPTQAELESLAPWLQVHDFGSVQTQVPPGSEQAPQFFAARAALLQEILGVLEPGVEEKTLLELGCASGLHCFTAAARHWQATGLDPREHHIRQASFLGGLVAEGFPPPRFQVGSDRLLHTLEGQWGVSLCYNVLQVLGNPGETLKDLRQRSRYALILETPVYTPPCPEPIFIPGNNWLYQASCQITNHGALKHHKKGIEDFALVLSFPALVYLLFQAGFAAVAYLTPPSHWQGSGSRGLEGFFTGHQHLLVATTASLPREKLQVPQTWVWLSQAPEPPNYDYAGPWGSTASPARRPHPLVQALGRKLMAWGRRLGGQ
ncbi:MAG: class I SAM-dependent methyltransferase [Thermodesulfobacteriota bacterium]